MENSTIKINLSAFVHIVTTVKNKAGNPVKGIFIPLEKNNIFEGKKGLYVDLIAFPIKNNKTDSKDTHLIKQSISKEEREKMTQEQQNNLPIIGNMIDWNYVKQSGNEDPDLPHDAVVETTEEDLPY